MIAFELQSGCDFSQKTTLLSEKKYFSISPLFPLLSKKSYFSQTEIKTKSLLWHC